jgi:uncharacterized protein YceK
MTRTGHFETEMQAQDAPCKLPKVYSGTLLDVYAVKQNTQIGAFLFWDIPFSLLADTMILPLTIYEQSRYGSFQGNRCIKDAENLIKDPLNEEKPDDKLPY